MRRAAPLAALTAVLACTAGDRPAAAPADASGPAAAPVEVTAPTAAADSLVLTLRDGGTVWYTHARAGRAADGTACVERGLEIRRGTARVAVPLLYTRDIPAALGDSAIVARLYLDCAPGDRYRVNTRTGQPTPIR